MQLEIQELQKCVDLIELGKYDQAIKFSKEYRGQLRGRWDDESVKKKFKLANLFLHYQNKTANGISTELRNPTLLQEAFSVYEDIFNYFREKLYDSDYAVGLSALSGMASTSARLPGKEKETLAFAQRIFELARWHDENHSIAPLTALYTIAVELGEERGYFAEALEYLTYCEQQSKPTPRNLQRGRKGRQELYETTMTAIAKFKSEKEKPLQKFTNKMANR